MKSKLACLLLLAVATVLRAQVPAPPAPPAPSKSRIVEPVRTIAPTAPSAVSAVTNTTTGVTTTKPVTTAPAQFTPLPALPLPANNPATRPPPAFPAFPAFPTLPGTESSTNATRATGPGALGTNGLAKPSVAGKDDDDETFLPDQILDSAMTQFQAAPLDQVLEVYSKLTGRTVLKPTSLPPVQITLKAQTKLTVKETLQAIDSVLSLNGIAVIYTGEKFLTVVATANAGQQGAMFNTNKASDLPEAGQYTTKIVEVKYAKPSEIVSALQPFASLGQNGLLPIDATGVIVIRDNAINIKRMMEVLEKIDKSVPSDEQFKVIPINYALAADVAQVLGSLTSGGAAGTSGGSSGIRGGTTGASRRGTGGSAFGGTTGLQGAGGAQPFGTQPGINPAAPGAAQPGTAQNQFQQRLNQIVSNITGGRTGSAPLLGEARIIPYDRSNSLLVLATTNELAMLTKLLKEIDVPQQQVLIEALIFETNVDTSRDTSFGVGQKTAAPGANFAGKGGINSIFTFSTNATALVGPATSGFGYLAQIGNNWAAAISLIERDSNSEILSRPRIQTSHAEAATIFSGGTTPYVTGTTFGVGVGSQNQIQQLQIGINMQVLPLITADGLVVLDINQTIESEGGSVKIDANLEVPKTVRHQAQAKVAVKDGETIILGGLIRTKKTKSVSGVPGLKDIPGLGVLFRSTSENPTRVELIVLIRPTVLKDPQAASVAAQAERERSPTIRGVEATVRETERKEIKRIADEEEKAKKRAAEESARELKRVQDAEIEALRKQLLEERQRKPGVPPVTPVPPAAPDTQQKSTDFLDLPKTPNP